MKSRYCIGVDVGTGSVRAGIFTPKGSMTGSGSVPIRIWRPARDHVEQSSDNIWRSACRAVRLAVSQAGIRPEQVAGIGFDATCSLVCLDREFRPLSISNTGDPSQNIIVWMDHRAVDQAAEINKSGQEALRYVGGVISPEMEPPKLLWLKENLKDTWRRAGKFMDLADFMVFRATGCDVRSLCTVVCKWCYKGHNNGGGKHPAECWDESFWRAIGLEELTQDGFARIGSRIRPMGEAVGNGLTARAAREMGLIPGTPAGVGIIDAHAGGLGMLGACIEGPAPSEADLEERLALIGGTSSCHMAVSRNSMFIKGIWGPYYSAMIPGLWLTEGGQSATGALVDHIIFTHARGAELKREARVTGRTVYDILNAELERLAMHEPFPAHVSDDLHILPHHHGNRSPLADPTLKGAVSGLSLDGSISDLARQYLATIQSIAYGTRHIIEEMNKAGYRIKTIPACGGGTKNPVFVREHADATGCRIVIPREPEAVLLGSAILGAVAGGVYPDILSAMAVMNRADSVIKPAKDTIAAWHDRKYRVFREMNTDFLKYRNIMSGK